ncbi:MAG: acetyl-CoA carboxylase biotin carboxylase subunit [Deltaproteobacteria bacterium]|nr:acetyl-CoA carboxylase biotin carboxylase subunit [Deltaproteobacteria bacterium]
MRPPPFTKVLVANRGEIAVRVIRACHELGCRTVAVYSDVDRLALHVRNAGEAYNIGPAPSAESYLCGEKIIEVARRSGAEAIHPGYGFLSENARFAQAVLDAGLVWIGPPPAAIDAMGSKTGARQRMIAAGVPVVPGTAEPIATAEEAQSIARRFGYPVMLKAAAGGGGKGMRRVDLDEDFPSAWRAVRSEAAKSFKDDAVYIEKFVENPKHVEIQVLSDKHGTHLHLFERDCSVQRRNQKVVEETPCPVLPDATRRRMAQVAVQAAAAVDYEGAGTCEFLYSQSSGEFYFLEMNTRLQVEHPITEMVTGIDLARAQIRVAAGEKLWFGQHDIRQSGHAIECRVYAEDPANNFAPAPGKISGLREPGGPWVRVDSGVYAGYEVPIHYDPMVSKLICWGSTREEAISRTIRALREYRVRGIRTSIPFFNALLRDPDFLEGSYNTGFLSAERLERLCEAAHNDDIATIAAALAQFEIDTRPDRVATEPPGESAWKRSGRPGLGGAL